MYNGGVIVEVCGVALCEEIRCISGGLSSEMVYLLISRASDPRRRRRIDATPPARPLTPAHVQKIHS